MKTGNTRKGNARSRCLGLTVLSLLVCHLSLAPAKAQKLVVAQPTIDCGKTGYKVPVTATFEVQNRGMKRLVITDVKADCGCTSADVGKKELAVGDKTQIRLTYDGRMLGHYEKQVAVYSNADAKPLYLKMKGQVLVEIKDYSGSYPYAMGNLLADRGVLEFDDVNKGDQPVQEINILNNGSLIMMPNVQHLPDYLTAKAVPERLLPGRAGKIIVTLNSQNIHSFGLTQNTVYLASQLGEKVNADNEMPVSIVLLPDLTSFEGSNKHFAPKMQLSESSVALGMVNGKKIKKATITIANNGHSPLAISSMQMFTRGMKVTLGKRQLKPGEKTKLKIEGDADLLRKLRTKPRVLMITNDPEHSKVVITVNVK